MSSGETVTFTMVAVTNTQTLMELYDAQGSAVYDSRSGEPVTGTQQLVWKSTATGRYYLGVVPLSTTFGCTRTVGYRLAVELLPLRNLYLPLIVRYRE
jgi:hypothetical protein